MTEELNLKEVFANFVNFISRNNKLILGIVLTGIISVVLFQKLTIYFHQFSCLELGKSRPIDCTPFIILKVSPNHRKNYVGVPHMMINKM